MQEDFWWTALSESVGKTKVEIVLASDRLSPMEIIDWLFDNHPEGVEIIEFKALDWKGKENSSQEFARRWNEIRDALNNP